MNSKKIKISVQHQLTNAQTKYSVTKLTFISKNVVNYRRIIADLNVKFVLLKFLAILKIPITLIVVLKT